MNTTELARVVAAKTGMSVSKAVNAIAFIFGTVAEAMVKGDTVKIHGFGNFAASSRPARKGRNPQTGVTIDIPALKTGHWSVASQVKDVLNGRADVAILFEGVDTAVLGKADRGVKPTPPAATPPAATPPAATPPAATPPVNAKTGKKAKGAKLPPPPPAVGDSKDGTEL